MKSKQFITPMFQIKDFSSDIKLYVKHEGFNITGSIKDRAARNVITYMVDNKLIDQNGAIIESSSGNMGIALSWYCNKNNLEFYCVVDPNINKENMKILEVLGAHIILVDKLDQNGGYLLSRIETVHNFLNENRKAYWVNQYDNHLVIDGYSGIADEICSEIGEFDYLFMTVSSGGSIAGVSKRIKEIQPKVKVVCVDAVGSVVFGKEPKKRFIPGAGASIKPENLKYACIDDVLWVDEKEAIDMCHKYSKSNFLLGGSSGLVLAGIKKYLETNKVDRGAKVVTIFPDRGDRYLNTIYNKKWIDEKFN